MILKCNHGWGRCRTGPTGRKEFSILVDSCCHCSALRPVHPERLTYQERRWVWRYNKRSIRYWRAHRPAELARQKMEGWLLRRMLGITVHEGTEG